LKDVTISDYLTVFLIGEKSLSVHSAVMEPSALVWRF